MKPATMDTNVRTTGRARPSGIAQTPRPATNRSARSMSTQGDEQVAAGPVFTLLIFGEPYEGILARR